MKKHKKLSLKKVNIATINHALKIRGGATDTNICDPKSFDPTNCLNATFIRGCVVTDPFGSCAQTDTVVNNCDTHTLLCDETTTSRGNGSI